jgi:hypothetical protein
LKQCPNCRGNLADFVDVCPYCGVATPIPQVMIAQSGWAAPPQTSNKALASLICGVLFFCGPAAIAAVILGHMALSDIKKGAGRIAGQGMAVAGLVMGYLGIAFMAIFVIATALSVRNTLRQDVPSNETSAIQTMKTYSEALKTYSAKCPQQGFPATLSRLGPGRGDCMHANLVEARLAMLRPARLGYVYSYHPGVEGANRVTVFALVASPVQPGFTGKRFFYLDEAGIIRQSDSQIVGPGSEPLDHPDGQEGGGDQKEPQ